ncbi:MAG: Fic family protein [Salinarimonas sp.]
MPLAADHDELEVENGFRQFDRCLEMAAFYLDGGHSFALRRSMIDELQREAVEGIEARAGHLRTTEVRITHSAHVPPGPHLINHLLVEFCDYINNNWHEKTAFHLAAYAMWRLNWINPYSDGNGRTSRAISYAILCIKIGYILPGSPTIPAQIEEDKTLYIKALEAADGAGAHGADDVSQMEEMIKHMLARQLMGIIDAAGRS